MIGGQPPIDNLAIQKTGRASLPNLKAQPSPTVAKQDPGILVNLSSAELVCAYYMYTLESCPLTRKRVRNRALLV
jgi:hypothetical protein